MVCSHEGGVARAGGGPWFPRSKKSCIHMQYFELRGAGVRSVTDIAWHTSLWVFERLAFGRLRRLDIETV